MARRENPGSRLLGLAVYAIRPKKVSMAVTPDFFARYTTVTTAGVQRRRHGRVHCQHIGCSLGPVLDLSASGMRVFTLLKPPKVSTNVVVILQSLDGPMDLTCTVAWTRRVGIFKHEVGLEFVDLPLHVQKALAGIARSVSHNEVIGPSVEELRKGV